MCSIVPVIILGTFCHQKIKNLLIERERTALADSLLLESTSLTSQFKEYENVMYYIAWNERLKTALNSDYNNNFDMYLFYRDTLNPLFTMTKSLNNHIERLTIYTDVNIYPQSVSLRPLEEIKEFSWYTRVLEQYTPLLITSMEQETLSLICQIYNIQSGNSAFLKMDINYEQAFLSHRSLYEDSYGLLIADEKGIPVYQFHTNDMEEFKLNPEQLIDAAASPFTQKDIVIENLSNTYNNWTLYLYRPTITIAQSVQTITVTVYLVIFICLVFILLLCTLFSNTIVQPLSTLITNMHKVECGTFDITITCDSKDEIGRLSRTFSNMVQRINHLVNEVLKSQILQQEQELKILQAQINPHFLYNALSLINSKAIIRGQSDIGQVALFLATFYRTALNNGKDIIPVKNELENIKSYINIQLLMHSDSFDVQYQIDSDILSLETLNLLLQPLVENAIIHGIDCMDHTKRGLLTITGTIKENLLILQVSDNGPGIPADILSHILDYDTDGYGVKNIHKRIQLFFGSQYGLHYESKPGTGTIATLKLPARSPA